MKIKYVPCGEDTNITTELVGEIGPEKNSGPYWIWTHDLFDTGAALYQLS